MTQSTRPDWLLQMKQDGHAGRELRSIPRGLDWELTLNFGDDWSADEFFISLREEPGAPDPVTATVTVSVGSYTSGVTPVTLSLTAAQTAALPADDNSDGLKELFYDILRQTGGTGSKRRIMAGNVFVSGKVTSV